MADDRSEWKRLFDMMDLDHNGQITADEVATCLKRAGEDATLLKVKAMIEDVDVDKDGQVSFDEFCALMSKIKKGDDKAAASGFAVVVKKTASLNVVAGATDSTQHSFSDEEKMAFTDWINDMLGKDPELADRMPLDVKTMALFTAVRDGILMCKLINTAVAGTVDERALNLPSKLGKRFNEFHITENQILCINSARAIGCSVINIGPHDLIEGRTHLVMGLVWQIIRIGLLSCINVMNHPELYRLLEPGETIQDLLKLGPEAILLRWVNYHLKAAGSQRRVTNFSGDIKDSEVYTVLLGQIAPKSAGVDQRALAESNMTRRAEIVLENADKIGCRKFLRPVNIVNGHPKLNLAFVANLFNKFPALEPVAEVVEIIEETREEKTFRAWMNSLGVDPFVNAPMYEGLKDGVVLLQLFDKVQPGIVDWKKVNMPPYKPPATMMMKQLENCNYAVALGKQLKFSLVGIDGSNVHKGDKTPVLAIVWQLMRAHTFAILNSLSTDGKRIQDAEIIEWVNGKLRSGGKSTSISSFKDSSIATSRVIADLLDVVKPESIDFSIMTPGSSEEERLSNAKYVVSIARKCGATIFCLPEDIVEVKPKMMLLLFAGIMAVGMAK